jgi:hypothetical protein
MIRWGGRKGEGQRGRGEAGLGDVGEQGHDLQAGEDKLGGQGRAGGAQGVKAGEERGRQRWWSPCSG